MYHILMDKRTNTYYMEPGDMSFYAYTSPDNLDIHKKNTVLVVTEAETEKEFQTLVYNAGFFRGYIDGRLIRLSKAQIQYYDRNPNEIAYAQYLLTHDTKYLELIKKHKLFTLCKLENGSVFFPTTQINAKTIGSSLVPISQIPDRDSYSDGKWVLAYTDGKRMPPELLKKYNGWRRVRMTFDTKCIVNESFLAD